MYFFAKAEKLQPFARKLVLRLEANGSDLCEPDGGELL